MKIVIDDRIPYIKGALEPFGEVVYIPGSKITNEIVKDADTIITRTRTICNEALLAGSSVKFIATATIGYDHIDTDYCSKAGISWSNAPGCNSKSVEQYIASALVAICESKNRQLNELCIGIVGVGNVGSKVARICRLFGMKVMLNDPPRERAEGHAGFVSLGQVKKEADIISLHVPLNMQGIDSTFHFANNEFFSEVRKHPILINSCRGEVVDTPAIKTALNNGRISSYICDCWENEPGIDPELLGSAGLATPHIAGYSKDGKANGTRMCIQAVSRFFGLGIDDWIPLKIELPEQTVIELDGTNLSDEEILEKAVLATYDIRKDDTALRNDPLSFENLRGDYPVRREFTSYTIKALNVNPKTAGILDAMGFKVEVQVVI